ncbi:class I SAM-dependent methyltransferase [Primorskyibacter sp. S87]|uniref:class I SAM-dependent methyltransferase n=1 Tax=Primorskyibacter sp. S87 TaxID=3415126 RepID=UPI003C7E06B1
MSPRIELALEAGLPLSGQITALLPTPEQDLTVLGSDVQVVQPFKPFHDHFQRLGYSCVPEPSGSAENVILFLPRAKAQAKALVALACAMSSGWVVVDGAKTDGVDSLLKEIRKRVPVEGPVAKAHGKIFWFSAGGDAFSDWNAPDAQQVNEFRTAPGVFSADGIDPASKLLADSLPKKLGRHVADLGAGWGYLSSRILTDETVQSLDLVEADHTALECAKLNISDPRARFHWADATGWVAGQRLDAVVMNPPFHNSRAGDPGLGQAFIANAAKLLSPSGSLWMVANRHLPYETTLESQFVNVQEIAGDNRFKVFHAARPTRARR